MSGAAMRRRQLATVVRLELRRSLLSLRGLWVFALAFAPVAPIALHAIVAATVGSRHSLEHDTEILAGIFQFYYLRVGVFFGCLGTFTRLFRGEMMERSAHYYLLAPVRRELLAVGKFAAGLLATAAPFTAGVALAFVAMYGHFGAEATRFVLDGPGLGHLASYVAVAALACVGYGAVFLLLGLVARNPILPAFVLLLWEAVNHALPAACKPLSVIFYLEPLVPVEAPVQGPAALFAIPADPISPFVAVPGLLLLSVAALALACARARGTEIDYTSD